MNDADRKAFEDWCEKEYGFTTGLMQDEARAGWQACCKWRDRQNTLWRNAAIRVGEDLHSVGPNGYYNMSAEEWLNWELNTIYSKPNFAPPAAQINQQLAALLGKSLHWLDDLCDAGPLGQQYPSDELTQFVDEIRAALAATQMRGGA